MVLLLAAGLAGCVGGADTRPETAAYISEAILVPACGRASCHSAATDARNLAFDTVADSITALKSQGRGGRGGGALVQPGNAAQSELYQVLTGGRKLMPPDAPLPQADIDLIKSWIDSGADGL